MASSSSDDESDDGATSDGDDDDGANDDYDADVTTKREKGIDLLVVECIQRLKAVLATDFPVRCPFALSRFRCYHNSIFEYCV